MKIIHFVLFLTLISFQNVFAQELIRNPQNSQLRYPGESSFSARLRAMKSTGVMQRDPSSPATVDVPFNQLDLSSVTMWPDRVQMEYVFEKIRDLRFLLTYEQPLFLRRISWLYPDDGCHVRAAMTNKKLEEWELPRLSKLFIFGDLNVKTSNSFNGYVEWWYHNVPVAQKNGVVYVFDAAIEPSRPLPLNDWVRLMGVGTNELTASLCDSYTYSPWDRCYKPNPNVEKGAEADQTVFLSEEWHQIEALGRQPDKELGEFPPWKK